VLFWAGWSDRSIEELKRLDTAAPDMAAHGVAVAAVSVDRYDVDDAEMKQLRERVERLQVHVPVFADRGLELFHAYGVVTVPSTAVVDANGKLAFFLYGYSHEQREQLFDGVAGDMAEALSTLQAHIRYLASEGRSAARKVVEPYEEIRA